MIMPGVLHLSLVQAIVNDGIQVAAQNVSATGEGAYTGEVAADAIKDYRIDWVLVGHSERRQFFGETQEVVTAKVKESEDCGLGIVYCCGEDETQRHEEQTEAVVFEQLQALKDAAVSDFSKVVIVYEPLWAMGTGTIASADQTQESCEMIRQWVKENIGEEQSQLCRIVYGGSVTETNGENLIKLKDVDGFLVGSTSTKPIFRTIFDIVNNYVQEQDALK